ncbi:MAG: tryptophan--tRNA ligase [Deltaproteobacteria bacterium]|nr:MAG: tryptophan--tRNA ligase [Deltaproteobacteria bacterium]
MRVLSGVQPSGKLHLGNYFGAIRQFVRYQDEADEALYFIADLHALTTTRDGDLLRARTLDVALDFLALGLDPDKAILFRQSDIPEIPALSWILSSVTPMGLLERGHSYKDKVARGLPADVGLFTYPVLMAADILLYGSDAVPVGKDQKQHLEFARDIATKFNMAFVKGYDPQDPEGREGGRPGILKLPEPLILDETAVVPGTDGQKMSKSYDNTIELFAPAKAVKKRFMSIKTDSTPVEAPKPEPHVLLDLAKVLLDPEEYESWLRSWRTGGMGYGHYKLRLVERFHELFDEARARRETWAAKPEAVVEILREGARRAREIAAPIWQQVVEVTGVSGSGPEVLLRSAPGGPRDT